MTPRLPPTDEHDVPALEGVVQWLGIEDAGKSTLERAVVHSLVTGRSSRFEVVLGDRSREDRSLGPLLAGYGAVVAGTPAAHTNNFEAKRLSVYPRDGRPAARLTFQDLPGVFVTRLLRDGVEEETLEQLEAAIQDATALFFVVKPYAPDLFGQVQVLIRGIDRIGPRFGRRRTGPRSVALVVSRWGSIGGDVEAFVQRALPGALTLLRRLPFRFQAFGVESCAPGDDQDGVVPAAEFLIESMYHAEAHRRRQRLAALARRGAGAAAGLSLALGGAAGAVRAHDRLELERALAVGRESPGDRDAQRAAWEACAHPLLPADWPAAAWLEPRVVRAQGELEDLRRAPERAAFRGVLDLSARGDDAVGDLLVATRRFQREHGQSPLATAVLAAERDALERLLERPRTRLVPPATDALAVAEAVEAAVAWSATDPALAGRGRALAVTLRDLAAARALAARAGSVAPADRPGFVEALRAHQATFHADGPCPHGASELLAAERRRLASEAEAAVEAARAALDALVARALAGEALPAEPPEVAGARGVLARYPGAAGGDSVQAGLVRLALAVDLGAVRRALAGDPLGLDALTELGRRLARLGPRAAGTDQAAEVARLAADVVRREEEGRVEAEVRLAIADAGRDPLRAEEGAVRLFRLARSYASHPVAREARAQVAELLVALDGRVRASQDKRVVLPGAEWFADLAQAAREALEGFPRHAEALRRVLDHDLRAVGFRCPRCQVDERAATHVGCGRQGRLFYRDGRVQCDQHPQLAISSGGVCGCGYTW